MSLTAVVVPYIAPPAASRVGFIKGIKDAVEDEAALRYWWRVEAPALDLPFPLPPLYYEISQV